MFPADAIRRVKTWLAVPSVHIITPGANHPEVLFRLLQELGTAGNLTTDAHLAALAIEYRAELASTDSDFSRFAGLRWHNPPAASRKR
jgi:predicted nucleic acid-binding protein